MNDRKSVECQKGKHGWGGKWNERIETRRTRVERKTFLGYEHSRQAMGTVNKQGKKRNKGKTIQKTKTRNRNRKPRKHQHKRKKERASKTKNVHRTHRRLSRIAKPPLRLSHGTEPAMMLARRRCPDTGGEYRRRIRGGGQHRTGCA